MKLTIKNVKSLIGISIGGRWDLESIDEFSNSYAFWFKDIYNVAGPFGGALKPIHLHRDGLKQWDGRDKKSIWTYKITDGGSVTAEWFTPQNAISIFKGILN